MFIDNLLKYIMGQNVCIITKCYHSNKMSYMKHSEIGGKRDSDEEIEKG